MSTKQKTEVEVIINHLEEMWCHLDVLFNKLNESDGWGQTHGADWTFADLPYHLTYCNRDLVSHPLELGLDLPEAEQELIPSMTALGAWNDRKFAERPSGQTVAEELQEMQASRDHLRGLMANMSDDDLKRPFWFSLFMGWTEAYVGLDFIRAHDWSEFTQLRVHMGLTEPVPGPEVTHAFVNTIMNFFPAFVNQEAAAGRQFTTVMAFTDPGVGAWTIQVDDGKVTVSQGESADADLVITQSAETFEKTRQKMHDPADAIQSGQMQVSDFENLAIFGQLFPM